MTAVLTVDGWRPWPNYWDNNYMVEREITQGDSFKCYRECPELCDRCKEIAAQALADRDSHKFLKADE